MTIKLTIIRVDSMETVKNMTKIDDVLKRRAVEQSRIRMQLNSVRAEEEALLKGGEDTVAWVKEELCIGCDQCTIVCEDDAIELSLIHISEPTRPY